MIQPRDVPFLKLGRLPKKVDTRTLQAAKYVVQVPAPPPTSDYLYALPHIPMYANDRVGDCTCASAGHKISAWRFYGRGQEHILTDADILAAYAAVSGYNPKDPWSDQGAVMLDVLNYWRKVGIGDHKIGAFVEVDPHDFDQVRKAIWLFGGVYAGVALPKSAQTELGKVWQSVTGKPGSWGGHAIAINQYGNEFLTCATWAEKQQMTWGWLKRYCEEAYAVLSVDFLSGEVAPNGFDLDTLKADLGAI